MSKISICCPVYTMEGNRSEKFLVEYLSNLTFQTFKDFEVVISDQSTFDNLKNIVTTFEHALNVRYIRNTSEKKNAANNVNSAIRHATGEIVKLLYMDDFFVDALALQKINDSFDSNPEGKWFISGFTHCNEDRTQFFNTKRPWYGNKYVNGDNTTGNPSNYAVRRECALEMDENLLWIVDGEYFYRSFYHYGDPIMIPDVLVCFRDHGDSAFKRPELRELDIKERRYCVDKFSRPVAQKLI